MNEPRPDIKTPDARLAELKDSWRNLVGLPNIRGTVQLVEGVSPFINPVLSVLTRDEVLNPKPSSGYSHGEFAIIVHVTPTAESRLGSNDRVIVKYPSILKATFLAESGRVGAQYDIYGEHVSRSDGKGGRIQTVKARKEEVAGTTLDRDEFIEALPDEIRLLILEEGLKDYLPRSFLEKMPLK